MRRVPCRRVRASLLSAAAGALVALPACVRYRPAPTSAAAVLAAVEAPPAGPLAWDAAVRWAVGHNPELRALAARAAAVNVEPAAEPVGLGVERDMDERVATTLSFDVLSLLGVGPRQAEAAWARARRSEAGLAHHARAREVAGELAEAFAVERALGDGADPEPPPDPRAFVAAGLEVAASERVASAVGTTREAELAARDAARRRNHVAFARLLGARPEAAPAFALPDAAWPPVPSRADAAAVLAARADLQRLLAAYEVADAELRRAVAAQAPAIELEPALAAGPTMPFGGVRLRLPVGADREAVALERAREAAREDLAAGVLGALAEAEDARAALDAATAALRAADARLAAGHDLARTARARLEAGEGSALELVMASRDVIEATAERRDAAVEAARARVAAARAAGWPGPEVVR